MFSERLTPERVGLRKHINDTVFVKWGFCRLPMHGGRVPPYDREHGNVVCCEEYNNESIFPSMMNK